MPSYNSIWIPTLVAANVLGVVFMLYALENLHGTVTGLVRLIKWYCCCSKDVAKQNRAAKGDSQQNGLSDTLPERKKNKKKSKKEKKTKQKEKKDAVAASDLGNEENLPLPVELSWEDVTFSVQPGGPSTRKTILHSSSGSFFPCEAVAIMGPSGAGKSTMLDILAGRKIGTAHGVGGSVTLNGMLMSPEASNMFTSYVGQEDVFMPTLSAWESLSFITQLCTERIPKAERKARMETALQTMGLLKVKNSKVGGYLPGGVAVRGLSGGERRRLSIACGLIGNPSIMFLDEPTTGLDSFAALAVMKYLNALTDRGHTVVSSIHQPRQEIFSSFDKVLVMSEGYVLYLAPPAYVVPWFSQVLNFPYIKELDGTVADWLISVTAVGFRKGSDSKARSMSSVEEVKKAAAQFAESSQVVREAEDIATSYMTDDLESVRDSVVPDLTPPASVVDGAPHRRNSDASAVSGSVFSGPSSMGAVHLLQGNNSISHEPTLKPTEEGVEEASQMSVEISAKQFSRSWFFQVWMLWKRSVVHQLRNPAEAATRIIAASISGLIPGLVWIRLGDNGDSAQERLALIFFAIVMFCMTPFGCMAFPLADKRFFMLDSQRGLYTPSAYAVAHVLSNMPFYILNTWASVLVTYGLAGLRYEGWAIMQGMGILSLHSLATNQFVTMCIWIANSQDLAFSLATIYISFSLLICGFYIRIRDMKLSVVRGLTWISFSKYTFQALSITELQNRVWSDPSCVPLTQDVPGFAQAVPLCTYPPNVILESYYDFNLTVPECCGALLGFWGLFCLVSYYALLKLYRKRV